MVESEGSSRFATLDGEKYGKMSILKTIEGESYSEGIAFDAGEISGFSAKSDKIVECNRMAKMLDGGLLTRIKFSKDAKADEIKNIIEKASDLFSSFKPVKKVAICSNWD
jgi:ribonucleoside-triphosphate reductase